MRDQEVGKLLRGDQLALALARGRLEYQVELGEGDYLCHLPSRSKVQQHWHLQPLRLLLSSSDYVWAFLQVYEHNHIDLSPHVLVSSLLQFERSSCQDE